MIKQTGFISMLTPTLSLDRKYHSAGYNLLMRDLVHPGSAIISTDDDLNNFSKIIINNGVNYTPSVYNIFGGGEPWLSKRIKQLEEWLETPGTELKTLKHFEFKDFFKRRKIDYTELLKSGSKLPYDPLPYADQLKKPGLLVGDSHSLSVLDRNSNLFFRNGLTLYSFLKEEKWKNFTRHSDCDITQIYLGNIDVRHHLCRQVNPLQSTRELASKLVNVAKAYDIKLTCLLPVESEARKIPKTGYYKGSPFYGSQKQRSELVECFNTILLESELPVYEHPKQWYEDLTFFENEVMEIRSSVHVRPDHYVYFR